MPIYEYFCKDCNVVFSFMSAKVAPLTPPSCPACNSGELTKQLSAFSIPVNSGVDSKGFDEPRVV